MTHDAKKCYGLPCHVKCFSLPYKNITVTVYDLLGKTSRHTTQVTGNLRLKTMLVKTTGDWGLLAIIAINVELSHPPHTDTQMPYSICVPVYLE